MSGLIKIGLTGGIGMGKSTAAKILRGMGLPVHNADREVHKLMRKGGRAVKRIAKAFPQALKGGAIDRKTIGKDVFEHPEKLRRLEKILHPLVQKAERDFLQRAEKRNIRAVVLEIPLLFETHAEKRCTVTICVTAPHALQRARVMQRKNMTEARFKAIRSRQMSDKQKRKLADYTINTGKGYGDTKKQLRHVLGLILKPRV